MNKKQSKRRRDIKSKLMAAICMLLVSSIMMVSTTYAWFTLSTAPEVTGINTAVGANGNLEMALQRPDGDSTQITSSTADSMEVKSKLESNITWGNLVDLEDANYGLSNITLYPAELNTVAGAEEDELRIGVAPLSTPRYGYDGRVTKLVQETYTATKVGDAGFSGKNVYGVRAIGLATGASAREVAFNTALSAASSATSAAQIAANSSLSQNGVALTDIAVTHAMGDDKYDDTDKAAVNAMLSGINTALDKIEEAMLQYILAETIGHAQDTTYEEFVTKFASTEDPITLANYASKNFTAPAGLADNITKLQEMQGKVQTAQSKLALLTDNDYEWGEISAALTPLVNMESENMTLNNKTISQALSDKNAIIQDVFDNGLTLKLSTGSGLYADIADFCGDYSAFFKAPVSNGTLSVDVSTTVQAHTTLSSPYLKAAATESDYVSEGTTAVAVMNEFYGYIVDLAFRTNAAGSHLKLQAEGIDRIYNGNDLNEQTMGNGATMSFKSDSVNFPAESVENLMKAIRIVFFDTDSQDIIAYAKLDAVNKSNETDGTITMPMVLTDKDGNAKMDGEDYDYRIMALDQNAVHELSVMVYLDGNSVTNADVAYDAESGKSMTGKMNLQFSSTATLVPMEYSDLRNGTGETTPGAERITLTNVTGEDGITVGTAVYDGTNVIIQLTAGAEADDTVVVTIGGTEYTATVAEVEGYIGVSVAAADVVADTVITVGASA